jgi:hypothetical protein
VSDEKTLFAQVDACLDTNPKIRKAGSVFATAIFEFLLRRRAIANSNGTIPIRYIDPDYLAGMLMMTCDEARHGTSRAIAAELITLDETNGVVFIVGWTPEWGQRPRTGSERTASWRDRKRAETANPDVVTERHTTSHVTDVTTRDESDVIEEKRREENREEHAQSALDDLKAKVDKATGDIGRRRVRKPEAPLPADWTPTAEHAATARELNVDLTLQARTFRAHAEANDRRCVRWNSAFTQWLLKSAGNGYSRQTPRPEPPRFIPDLTRRPA